ncbi:MAG TPA: TIGR00366 family protein [Streptosporangiales bacterium]
MLRRFTDVCVAYVQRFMPNPYLYAVILTFVCVILNFILVRGVTPAGTVTAWYQGVWGTQNIFTFALQMVLILVSGYTLAQAPVVRRFLRWLASKPHNQTQGALMCFFAAGVASLVNWGLGLIVAGVVAREVARRLQRNFHYGYLVAAGYMGYIVWTNGFSSSIALANTDPHSNLNIIFQMTKRTVPFTDSIFQPYSWIGVVATFVLIPVALKFMAPHKERLPRPEVLAPDPGDEPRTADGAETGDEAKAVRDDGPGTVARATFHRTPAEVLESAWILNLILAAAGIAYFVISGFALDIASLVMLFTVAGLILHWTPERFIAAFYESAKTSGSLILQYPLYGGIIALLTFAPTHGATTLAAVIAGALVHIANETTLPFFNYIGSLIISLFVPSGGGHWGVQGPVTIAAAKEVGLTSTAYLGKLSMSVAMGEQVTNMIQPFWALPVLAIAGLRVRDMMGFTVVAFVIGAVVFGACTFIPAL